MKTHYILIDYENVQPAALAGLNREPFKVVVFVGANQTKIAFDVAASLHAMGTRATYIKVTGSGANTLDFHIAFYIGQLAAKEPDACFHIISKDGGFDPLIQHLKSRKICACRSADVDAVPTTQRVAKLAAPAKPVVVPLSLQAVKVVAALRKRGTAKPQTVKALTNTIKSLFHTALTDESLAALVGELQKRSLVTVSGDKVTYHLPDAQG